MEIVLDAKWHTEIKTTVQQVFELMVYSALYLVIVLERVFSHKNTKTKLYTMFRDRLKHFGYYS